MRTIDALRLSVVVNLGPAGHESVRCLLCVSVHEIEMFEADLFCLGRANLSHLKTIPSRYTIIGAFVKHVCILTNEGICLQMTGILG